MIQGIEIPMKKEIMTKKVAFMRGTPSILQYEVRIHFLIKNIKKADGYVKVGGS